MNRTWESACSDATAYILNTDYAQQLDLKGLDNWLNVGVDLAADDFAAIAQSALLQIDAGVNTTQTDMMDDVERTVISKQKDYGHGNIMRHGLHGVIVRMCDKVERIKNLESKRFGEPVNESLGDSWLDLVGYCIIAIMLLQGTFELPLEQDVPAEPASIDGAEMFAGRKPYGVLSLPCQVTCENGYVYAWSQPSNSWVFVGQKAPA